MTCDTWMWHVTRDMWHVTWLCDTWHMTCDIRQNFSSHLLLFVIYDIFKIWRKRLTHRLNNEAACRRAPDTLDLLKRREEKKLYQYRWLTCFCPTHPCYFQALAMLELSTTRTLQDLWVCCWVLHKDISIISISTVFIISISTVFIISISTVSSAL